MAFSFLTQELAIDLGTANTVIFMNDKIVVDEPSIVAIDQNTGKPIAFGHAARMMHERTHPNIKDRNFGGGWDSISTSTKDIINSAFEISTTQLPASRIHAPGGTLELKVSLGFEVLEIVKGTWVEAIFAKKKEPVEKVQFNPEPRSFDSDEDGDLDDDAMDADKSDYNNDDEEEEISENDDTFYSSYAPEAEIKDEDEEGFGMEEVSEL